MGLAFEPMALRMDKLLRLDFTSCDVWGLDSCRIDFHTHELIAIIWCHRAVHFSKKNGFGICIGLTLFKNLHEDFCNIL